MRCAVAVAEQQLPLLGSLCVFILRRSPSASPLFFLSRRQPLTSTVHLRSHALTHPHISTSISIPISISINSSAPESQDAVAKVSPTHISTNVDKARGAIEKWRGGARRICSFSSDNVAVLVHVLPHSVGRRCAVDS